MAYAQIGQKVAVDMAGFSNGGVSFGQGCSATGIIVAINAIMRLITVKLDIVFGGQDTVTVPPERVRAIQ